MVRKAVIMAGGSGVRLWPYSREARPKQFLAFDERGTLLQQTAARLCRCVDWPDLYVCTLDRYRNFVLEQLPELSPEQLILEPCGKGTGPASAYAAAWLRRRFGDPVVATLASDAWIEDAAAFAAALVAAFAAVEAVPEAVATIGIQPTRPATGFGYIERGKPWGGNPDVFEALSFTEKPDQATAQAYLAARRYLWNASFFVWRASRLQELFAAHAPDTGAVIERIMDREPSPSRQRELYAGLARESVDRAVMEKARPMLVVPAAMGWADLGTWRSVAGALPDGLPGRGGRVSVADEDVLVFGDQRLVATAGLRNVAVIDTPDALLVCSLEYAEELKQVIDALRRQGKDELV
jgi:mannose-1-phosphate guanylyltransferase